jgi:diguanylate cyclase (GGDEF)-like protein
MLVEQVTAWIFALAHAGVASGCVVALATICLLQYCTHLHRMSRIRREIADARERHDLVRNKLRGMTNELSDVKRDRKADRFEAQVLREFVSQEDGDKALRGFMRRFIPDPGEGFAAFLRPADGSLLISQSCGLSAPPGVALNIDSRLVARLTAGEVISLNRVEVRNCRLWESFAPADRDKIRQLHLFGATSVADPPGIFMTTALAPPGLEATQQLELARRLLSSIACNLRDKRQLESQQEQLRSTEEMLDLRSVLDRNYDSPAHLLEEFLGRAAGLLSADRASLHLHNAAATTPLKALVRCGNALQAGLKDQWQRHEDELAQTSLASGKTGRFSSAELGQLRINSLIGSALTVPVLQQNRLLGLVCFSRRACQEFTEGELALAAWSGKLLAELIPRAVNQAVVERQARLDGLTQLANRSEFDRQIEQQLQMAVRRGTPLSLLMFDLDRFKSINDAFGHRGGDAVLRSAAGVIRDCVREIRSADRAAGVRPFLARYGGEEIAALLQLDTEAARRIGEIICKRLEKHVTEFEGRTIRVTTSAGLATFPQHAETVEELISAADAALYQAKARGRNRLELARPTLVVT